MSVVLPVSGVHDPASQRREEGTVLKVQVPTATRTPAAPRLDRLPIVSFHREIMGLLGLVFFFELGDINTFAFAAPAILTAWHLSISTISRITSATFLGMFVGATTGGWFSDRVGRKRALVCTTAWYSSFSLLNGFAWEPIGLLVTRLMTGVGLSAMTVAGVTYISEMFPTSRRGAYQGWILMIGLTGIPITAYVARFCVPLGNWGWRLVFVWGALGMVFLFFAHRLEESPRWYENQGRLADADEALARIETRARAELGELPPIAEVGHATARRAGYAELFSPVQRGRTIALMLIWTCQTIGFYGFTAWVPTLLVAHGFSLVNSLAWSSVMWIGAIPGAAIGALVSDKWERKWLICIGALVIATCGLIYGVSFTKPTIMIFGFLVAMFLQTSASLLFAYTPESFPTEIRTSGTGLAYGMGRLSNVFGPLVIAFIFNRYGYTSVFGYIASVWLLVAVMVAAFGPSTKGRRLT